MAPPRQIPARDRPGLTRRAKAGTIVFMSQPGPCQATSITGKPASRRLCLAVMAGSGLGCLTAAMLIAVILVARPGQDPFPLSMAVMAVEVFRYRFERRLRPRPATRAARLSAAGRIIVTAMIIVFIALLVLAAIADAAFHLDTAAWQLRGAASALLAEFIMLFAIARKGLRTRGYRVRA
jgi:hypothetical protein